MFDMLVKVAGINDIKSGESKVVEASGKTLALFNVDNKFFCIDNTCPHKGGPLGEGFLENHTITCPWHGAKYDVRTGKLLSKFPPSHDLNSYKIVVKGNEIFADL